MSIYIMSQHLTIWSKWSMCRSFHVMDAIVLVHLKYVGDISY